MSQAIPPASPPGFAIHQRIEELLPWYVNATLSAEETAEVETHIAQCQSCRDSLAVEEALAQQVKLLPPGPATTHMPQGPSTRPQAPLTRPRVATFWTRRVPIGWTIASPLLAASLAAVAMLGLRPAAPVPAGDQPGAYVALSSASTPGQGNLLVKLQPEANEGEVRSLLQKIDARVVDGPTVADAWVLRVKPGVRDAALHTLRQASIVTMAQPLVPQDPQP